jgi:hypothetical protein
MTRLLFDTGVVRWDPSAAVRGVVFHDLNGDGIFQPGEKGIEGVQVTAGLKKSVLTDSKGRFVFRRIFGKSVPISIDPGTIPKGYVFSTPAFQTVYPGKDTIPVLLFGALGRAEIRGRVFYDIDGDGQYSASDRGIDNVRIQLGSDTAKTDRSGWFFFRGLAGGSYIFSLMLESLPLPYLPLVPVRQPIELAEGDVKFIDIPVMMRRILSGRVYLDRNQNRKFDIGEEPLLGISICLDGKSAVSTDAQGVFRFPELVPGHHQLMLNCGMPMDDMIIFSISQPVIEISPDDPEMITVDFGLQRKSDLVDEIIEELRRKKKDFTEL